MASPEGKRKLDSLEQDISTSPEGPSAKKVRIDDPVPDDGKVKYSLLH